MPRRCPRTSRCGPALLSDLVGPFLCPASRIPELRHPARDRSLEVGVIVDTGVDSVTEAVAAAHADDRLRTVMLEVPVPVGRSGRGRGPGGGAGRTARRRSASTSSCPDRPAGGRPSTSAGRGPGRQVPNGRAHPGALPERRRAGCVRPRLPGAPSPSSAQPGCTTPSGTPIRTPGSVTTACSTSSWPRHGP